VVTISISAEALAAIRCDLARWPRGHRRPDRKGGHFITLPNGVVDRLNYLRAPRPELF